jgi:hypothetical protein
MKINLTKIFEPGWKLCLLLKCNRAFWELSLTIIFCNYILNKYGFYDVPSNVFKYIHCDLMSVFGYYTITFIVGSTFVNLLFGHLNVGAFVQIFSFFVMFKTKVDWNFLLRVEASIVIKFIYPLLLNYNFVSTHSIFGFWIKIILKRWIL